MNGTDGSGKARDDYIDFLAVVLIGVPAAAIIKAVAPGMGLTPLTIIALVIGGAVTYAVVRPLRRD